MRKVIYTALMGDIDFLQPPGAVGPGWECICFSDRPQQCPGWETIVVAPSDRHLVPRRASRQLKILSHVYLPQADVVFWMDANMTIACDLDAVVEAHLSRYDLATFQHPERDCIYDEAVAVVESGKDDPDVVNQQVARYRQEGYPPHNGLANCCVLLRRHTNAVKLFNKLWWRELTLGSQRDQLSFNYVANRVALKYSIIERANSKGPQFIPRPHAEGWPPGTGAELGLTERTGSVR